MDEARIERLIAVMTRCHGKDAAAAARKRIARCQRRNEADWSSVWQEVANRLLESATGGAVAETKTSAMSDRILVVEDDDATRYALSRTLAANGYDVDQAQDHREALPLLEDGKPIVLLLIDLVMPGVNGFALARMARLRHREIKVVYMTGYDDIPTAEAIGPIMHKPVDVDSLLAVIRTTLQAAYSSSPD
jgi:CheY-like chemotaxis protein